MTENEAIKILDTEKHCLDKSTKGLCKINCGDCKANIPIAYQEKSYEVAITALEEIQQYRKIGTVEEIKDLLATISEAAEDVDESGISVGFVKDLIQLKKYREIGTVEECRDAVERQKPQKPKDSLKIDPVIDENGAYVDADTTVYLLCPNCGEMVGIEDNCDRFCHECGQAIDNENLEGMEDEGKAI